MSVKSLDFSASPTFEGLTGMLVASGGCEDTAETHVRYAQRWQGAVRIAIIAGSSATLWLAILGAVR